MKLLISAALALALASPAYAQLAPPNAAGITYGHVHLSTSDIEAQKKMWVDHFGGAIVSKGPLTAVKLPNMLIAFRATAQSSSPSSFSAPAIPSLASSSSSARSAPAFLDVDPPSSSSTRAGTTSRFRILPSAFAAASW